MLFYLREATSQRLCCLLYSKQDKCLDTGIYSEYTRDNAFSEPVKREIASADRLMLIDGSRIYVYNKRIAG